MLRGRSRSLLKQNPRVLLLLLLLAILLLCYAVLRLYSVDLVHTVVVHALIQKAPAGYPHDAIQDTFEEVRRSAEATGNSDAYLARLFRVAQRLEKTQRLTEKEVSELLETVGPRGGGAR